MNKKNGQLILWTKTNDKTMIRMQNFLIVTILLLASWTTTAFSKGCSGTYYIKGTAYSADKTILKNATLTVKYGDKIKTFLTDSNGHFEIEIFWQNTCPSGETFLSHRRNNRKANPKFIYINYADNNIKLNNEWKKYGQCFPQSRDAITWNRDIKFVSG